MALAYGENNQHSLPQEDLSPSRSDLSLSSNATPSTPDIGDRTLARCDYYRYILAKLPVHCSDEIGSVRHLTHFHEWDRPFPDLPSALYPTQRHPQTASNDQFALSNVIIKARPGAKQYVQRVLRDELLGQESANASLASTAAPPARRELVFFTDGSPCGAGLVFRRDGCTWIGYGFLLPSIKDARITGGLAVVKALECAIGIVRVQRGSPVGYDWIDSCDDVDRNCKRRSAVNEINEEKETDVDSAVSDNKDKQQMPTEDATKVYIFTDRTSVLHGIQGDTKLRNSVHAAKMNATVSMVQRLARDIMALGVEVEFAWVPGREQIQGNRLAHKMAKRSSKWVQWKERFCGSAPAMKRLEIAEGENDDSDIATSGGRIPNNLGIRAWIWYFLDRCSSRISHIMN